MPLLGSDPSSLCRNLFCRGVLVAAALFGGGLLGCPDPAEEDTHGFIRVDFRRGASQANDPFVGTATVLVVASYQQCLQDFYAANPGLRQSGPEGALIFGPADLGGEGWQDRLCDADTGEHLPCTVTSIEQSLEGQLKQLKVTYQIMGNLEDRRLLFGPLPTGETAQCEAGELPIVTIETSTRGRDANGNDVWVTESRDPPEAATNQGGAVVVKGKKAGT